MQEAPEIISRLVDKFANDADHDLSAACNETLTRVDFIKPLDSTRPGHERDALQRQIDATDTQIDKLVYDLYNLTDNEIQLVEEAA